MRKLRRPLAAAVVLAVALVACFSSLDLATTSQPVVTSNYSSYDFTVDYGPVPIGMLVVGPRGSSFVISPQGSFDDDYITNIALQGTCPDFGLILPPPLGSGGGSAHVYSTCSGSGGSVGSTTGQLCTPVTYSFNATFRPSIATAQSCLARVYSISAMGSAAQFTDISLFGSGAQTAFAWDVEPPSIAFGTVPVTMTSPSQSVTVHNTGSGTFTVMEVEQNDPLNVFTVTLVGSNTVGAGSAATYKVTCTPPQATMYSASVKFTTSSTQGNLMATVNLSCSGASSQVITSPNPIDMGDHLVDDGGSVQPIEFHNVGGAGTTLSGFTIVSMVGTDLDFVQPPGSIPLGAGSDVMGALSIRYTPTTEQPSGNLGTLMFADGSNNLSVPILGSALTASIGANPASVDFGTLCVGASANQDVTVATNAAAPVLVTMMKAPGAPFSASPTLAPPINLPGGGGSGFTIHAAAHPTAAGDFSDVIELDTNIPMMSMRMIPVHANAIAGGSAPTPDTVHFGAVGVGQTSPEKDVTLTNCSDAPLMINGTHIDGLDKSEFISPNVEPTVVPPGMQITFHVLMSPRTNGTKAATLTIDDDAGGAVVALDGTAFGGTDDGGADRRTYYACSSSGGGAAWPVGLAVIALAVRRRRRSVRA